MHDRHHTNAGNVLGYFSPALPSLSIPSFGGLEYRMVPSALAHPPMWGQFFLDFTIPHEHHTVHREDTAVVLRCRDNPSEGIHPAQQLKLTLPIGRVKDMVRHGVALCKG